MKNDAQASLIFADIASAELYQNLRIKMLRK